MDWDGVVSHLTFNAFQGSLFERYDFPLWVLPGSVLLVAILRALTLLGLISFSDAPMRVLVIVSALLSTLFVLLKWTSEDGGFGFGPLLSVAACCLLMRGLGRSRARAGAEAVRRVTPGSNRV